MTRPWLTRLLLPVGVLLAYFLVPVDEQNAPAGIVIGVLVAIMGLAGVAWIVADEVQRAERRLRPVHLMLALELVVVLFALIYFVLAMRSPAEFSGLHTRLDALYFSLTTVATVGYGDVNAAGQLARSIVSAQLVFNLAFVAALVGLFQGSLADGRENRRTAGKD